MKREQLDGREIAAARNKWFASAHGQRLLAGVAEGQYLQNRLELAFLAGIDAALEILAKTPRQRTRKKP